MNRMGWLRPRLLEGPKPTHLHRALFAPSSSMVGGYSSRIAVWICCRAGGDLISPVHAAVEHTENPIGSEQSFAVVYAVVFAVVGLRPLLGDGAVKLWAILAGVVILLVGLVVPRLLIVPNRLWCRLGLVVGAVMSQVVMAVIFFLVLTPTGLAMRLFRSVPTEHQPFPDAAKSTYWIPRGQDENPMGSLRNQY